MAGESLNFPITAEDRASSKFRDVGRSALDASAKIDVAAASLKLWNDTDVKSKKATDTLVASQLASAKAFNALGKAQQGVRGEFDKSIKALGGTGLALDNTAKKAENAAGGVSGLAGTGGLAGGGMGALIAAGVALAPVIATVATGTAGLGIAAYGIAKPIQAAAQATGGLQANMAKLNPEQQQVALGILALGKTFAGFQHALEPVVLGDFNQGLHLAGTLLHGVEPVAAATGKALGGFLGQVDAVFRSGTWQGFFAFMARTAGPDIQLLGRNFADLALALPPLVEQLQPVATDLLNITDAGAKLIGWAARASQSLSTTGQHMNALEHVSATLRTLLFSPGAGLAAALKILHITGGDAGKGLDATAAGAVKSIPPVFSLNTAVANLNTSMTTLVGNLLTLQGGNLSWKQAMQAADAQLRSNNAGLEGNSKNALANKQAVLNATNQALSFAEQQLSLGKNIDGADRTVQRQINWLQGLHDKSKFVQDEIHALRKEEQLLEQQRLNQLITVHGKGSFSVVGTGPFAGKVTGAAGAYVTQGTTPTADNVIARVSKGELIVPTHMVNAGAVDHLRGKIPGFAAGGIVPSYSGSVGGLKPWLIGNDQAMVRLIDLAVVKATLAGIHTAEAAARAAANRFGAAGPGGGAPAANAALARRMMPAWGSGAEWAAWNYVAMRESGWNQFARNPSSGAYGIPQALPPSKMGPAANPPQSNPAAQISWMIGYIRGRYGDPIGAAAHERAFNWYDKGGFLPPGLSMAYNGTGRPEMVIPSRGGGAVAHIQLEWVGGNAGDGLLQWIQKNVRIRGGGDVQKAFGRP